MIDAGGSQAAPDARRLTYLVDAMTAPVSSTEIRRRVATGASIAGLVPPAGCLLFNCSGRGKSLYGIPHQDVKTIQTISGKVPVGGFFCNGEISHNRLYGYTGVLTLFV